MSEGPSVAEQQMVEWLAWVNRQSPEGAAAQARQRTRSEVEGPLEGAWGPHGQGGATVTASGRSPEEAASSGPVSPSAPGMSAAPPEGPAGGGGVPASRPERQGSGQTVEEAGTSQMTPQALYQAYLEQVGRQASTEASRRFGRPPPGYIPPTDPARDQQVSLQLAAKVAELLEALPVLVRQAAPSNRERSLCLTKLEEAGWRFDRAMQAGEQPRG